MWVYLLQEKSKRKSEKKPLETSDQSVSFQNVFPMTEKMEEKLTVHHMVDRLDFPLSSCPYTKFKGEAKYLRLFAAFLIEEMS